MKCLLIGDPHATNQELDDCRALFSYVEEILAKDPHDAVIILGDLYHTHAIMHVEVMAFWTHALSSLAAITKVYALVGNHDMPGNSGSTSHALLAHSEIPGLAVVDASIFISDGVLAIPYFHSEDEMRTEILRLKELYPDLHTVICHATFQGAQYENGFYAKDGIEADSLPVENIISGHVHKPAKFGKVWYPGAPRWRTLSDANEDRFLESVHFSDTGYKKLHSYPTEGICKSIRHFIWEENGVYTEVLPDNAEIRVDLKGSPEWIETKKALLLGRAKIRTFPNRGKEVVVKESDGMNVALNKYTNQFQPKRGTPKTTIQKMVTERIGL